jgi:hypothetical protein
MLARLWQVIGLVLVAAMVYGLYRFTVEAVRVLALLDKTVEAAIIAASATIVASVITIVLGNAYASRLHNEKANRDKKVPVYEQLIGFTFRMFQSSIVGKPLDESEMIDFMTGFNAPFTVWASDIVLAAYVKWRRFITNKAALEAQPHNALFLYEELIFAIRHDLGHRNKNLSKGDVLTIFVNDVDTILHETSSKNVQSTEFIPQE